MFPCMIDQQLQVGLGALDQKEEPRVQDEPTFRFSELEDRREDSFARNTLDLCLSPDPLSEGFSDSGIYMLPNRDEMDMGVDWDEPLEVRTRAVRRALKRRLGPEFLQR